MGTSNVLVTVLNHEPSAQKLRLHESSLLKWSIANDKNDFQNSHYTYKSPPQLMTYNLTYMASYINDLPMIYLDHLQNSLNSLIFAAFWISSYIFFSLLLADDVQMGAYKIPHRCGVWMASV